MTIKSEEFIVNVGDINPLDHGGYFIFRDNRGRFYAEYFDEPYVMEDRHGDEFDDLYEIYRFDLDMMETTKGEWFHDDLDDVAAAVGATKQDIQNWFASDDPRDVAFAYRVIGDYFGWSELDHYPLRIRGRKEMEERYRDLIELGAISD